MFTVSNSTVGVFNDKRYKFDESPLTSTPPVMCRYSSYFFLWRFFHSYDLLRTKIMCFPHLKNLTCVYSSHGCTTLNQPTLFEINRYTLRFSPPLIFLVMVEWNLRLDWFDRALSGPLPLDLGGRHPFFDQGAGQTDNVPTILP